MWRMRSKLPETALALGFESQGVWDQAQLAYEQAIAVAQTKG